jgi:hypothetical protein
VDIVDSQVSKQAGRQVIVHTVHMGLRGQNAWVQSVDTVDTLDVRFKSLYPFCLFFKQLFFSQININSPQYPQSYARLVTTPYLVWVTLSIYIVHSLSKQSTNVNIASPGEDHTFYSGIIVGVDSSVKEYVTMESSTT